MILTFLLKMNWYVKILVTSWKDLENITKDSKDTSPEYCLASVQFTLHKVVNVLVKPSWACSWGFHEHFIELCHPDTGTLRHLGTGAPRHWANRKLGNRDTGTLRHPDTGVTGHWDTELLEHLASRTLEWPDIGTLGPWFMLGCPAPLPQSCCDLYINPIYSWFVFAKLQT